MKRQLLLGLLFMLLAPIPASAKYVNLIVDSPDGSIELYKDIFSLEGGTYCGLQSFEIGAENENADTYFIHGLRYEFDDNLAKTRLHANLSDIRIKVYAALYNEYGMVYDERGSLLFDTGDAQTSEFVSDEIDLSGATVSRDDEINYYIDVYKKRSVDVAFLGEGLSVELRDNHSIPLWVEDYYTSHANLVSIDSHKTLEEQQGPMTDITMEGYYNGQMTLCINGFDWPANDTSLRLIIDGDTVKDLRTYREKHDEYNEGNLRRPVKTVTYNGVDIPLNKPNTTVYAKIIDVTNEFEAYPFTYRIDTNGATYVKSVDKNYSGNLELEAEVTGNYIGGRKVVGIDDQAMLNCKGITSLSVPSSVSTIGVNALSGMTSLARIEVDSENRNFSSADGVLFNKNMSALIQFPIAKATQYEVPEGTTSIERDAFYQSKLTSITLPTTLTAIDYDAFGYSKQLKEIDLPASVSTLGEYVFDHCTGLTTVNLPAIKRLPKYAFNACTALQAIVLPKSLQEIGDNAFKGCKKITEVKCLMASPIPMPDNAFTAEVYNNATLQVPRSAKNSYEAADGWKNFKNIVADPLILFDDDNVKAICVAHWDTNGDSEIDLGEAAAVTNLGGAFTGNKDIKHFNELRFFTGLTKIDDNAFKSCKSLQSVVVPAGVKQIGKSAFYSCYELTSIVLPEGLEEIHDYAIGACIRLTKIELPSTLTTIKTRAFYYDRLLRDITLPASVTSIGNYAFASSPLTSVTVYMMSPCAIAANVFTDDTYNKGTLNVPFGTSTLYKTTNYWSKFANIKTMTNQVSITAEPISIIAGESGDLVLSLEQGLPLVSFQFDLTLVDGITLQNASLIPSSDFVVSTAKHGYNCWRILAYSPTNTPIEDNVGDLISLNIAVEELLAAGSRKASITDITLTSPEGSNLISYSLAPITTTITVVDAEVTDAGKGDVNLDGAVNVQDIVVLINHIFGKTPKKFSSANADANGDGKINVSDISTIVSLSMPSSSTSAAPAHAPAASLASMTWDTTDGLALTIDDATTYVAAQMDVTVDGTLQVNNITAADGHTPVWQKTGENRYRVLVFSNANDTFSAYGPHLIFDVQGEGEIALSNALLVDAAGDGFNAAASSTGITTGIAAITTELSAPADVYSVSGQLVRRQATSLKDLPTGIYIVNGRKMAVR